MSIKRDSARVKEVLGGFGFGPVRIARAVELIPERKRYLQWLEDGRQAGMAWMTPERAERSTRPEEVLPGCRSVVSVALPYWSGHRGTRGPNEGQVARYAWGDDYHAVMGRKLDEAARALQREFGGEHRWYVDTGPMLDKALAARAGIGWYGKNANLLTEEFGSWVLLGEILTTLHLTPDMPIQRTCGSCRLCLTACPTGALGPEHVIDSNRCISYLTIEHRGPIPRELRPLMGAWVFGCDICQDVCPPSMEPVLADALQRRTWASGVRRQLRGEEAGEELGGQVQQTALVRTEPRQTLDLLWLLRLTHEDYLTAFRGTSIRRAKVWMLRRNAAVALGNVGTQTSLQPLSAALTGDDHPMVRGHAAWALGRLADRLALAVDAPLHAALENETDEEARDEIRLALSR